MLTNDQMEMTMQDTNGERIYTQQQSAFLEVLFNEAKGNLRKAMTLAGYGDNTPVSQVVKSLSKEITELSREYLAAHSAKATIAMINVLDDPSALGTPNLIKAAENILNRSGVAQKEAVSLDIPEGGLVILPAKNIKVTSVE